MQSKLDREGKEVQGTLEKVLEPKLKFYSVQGQSARIQVESKIDIDGLSKCERTLTMEIFWKKKCVI